MTNPTTNWLGNAGFESPAASNSTTPPPTWGNWGSCYLSTQYAYAGSQSLVISGANSGVTQIFSVTAGASYTESVYAMTPAGNPLTGSISAEIQFFFFNSSGTMLSPYSPPNQIDRADRFQRTGGPLPGSVGNQGWNYFSTTAVAPAARPRWTCSLATCAQFHLRRSGVFRSAKFGHRRLRRTLTAGSISNSGTIVIGSPDTVTVNGTYTQTSTGVLDLQLGGSPASGQYGSLTITGAANLAGTLQSGARQRLCACHDRLVHARHVRQRVGQFLQLRASQRNGISVRRRGELHQRACSAPPPARR